MAALGGTAPYYEKDAALRAYANRVFILAGVLALINIVLCSVVLVTRSKPPIIIPRREGWSGHGDFSGRRLQASIKN